MSDESVSGSDPDLDPDLEPEDMEEEEEDDDEEEMDEDNDGDDEDDVPDDKGKSQEAVSGEDGEPKRSNSTTSNQSDQKEHTVQNQRKGSPAEEAQNNLHQKPVQLRRNIRKLLREDQLEAGTLAAQQEELERRKRLEQQRKDYPAAFPTLPFDFFQEEIVLRPGEASHLPPLIPNQEVICLDSSSSSGSESSDEDVGRQLLGIKDEVIELSSGEDEGLQIVDSNESTNDVEDDATAESSGSHVNDALNLPDALGRVLVNINHPPNEEDLFLAPQLARAVKPHQVGGIRFLYDNLVESLERFKGSSGFGCILAHSMGLGKTLQVISFLDVLFRHTEAKTVLAIVPVNTLQNWLAEFNIWLPSPESLPEEKSPEEISPRTFKVYILNDEHKTTVARAKVVNDWSANGGVLLMGYEMYRLLSLKKSFTTGRKKKKPKKNVGPVIIDLDEEDRQQELLISIEKAISRPGPDVVICDEGHRIKNCHASTSQALKNIRSRRRVVLTGYPLQNNLIEYWCMVDFVRPDFLGTRQEFSNMFERPILNGQCIDSTPQDVRLMRYRSHVLHSLLEGFVQRRGHSVLKIQLPSKEEHVILVRLSNIQRALYTEFMNRFRDAGNSGWLGLNPLKAFCVCCKIWNHPDVLHEALQKENLANEHDLDVDDLGTNASCKPLSAKVKLENNAAGLPGGETTNSKFLQTVGLNPFQEKAHQVVTYEWAKDIFCDYQTGILENSPKMVLLFHLIEESVKLGDKLLVFSQSLSTLSVIEEFLAKRPKPASPGTEGDEEQTWVRNLSYYRLDGSTSASERERLINLFNDPNNTQAWLFLLSTRAGCLGVNLIGANRVVVFDASWNPCHDAQAVCRVYRYGQKKPCHIYRLVSDYTLEKKIYDRQITKQGMSDRVVDDLNPVLNFTRREVENLLHFVEEEPKQVEVEAKMFKESVIQLACLKYPHLITREPFQHESLLLDRKEHKLTRAEKKAAKRSYEEEKRASVPYTRPSYAQYYPALDQHLANIPAFSQRNWRPLDDKPVASVRPLQSTPIPMLPRHVPGGHVSLSGQSLNFPVNYLQRAGVLVQKIVTTTDIVIPGANTSTDVQARISAGESIHIIRGTKGTYIRTNDGRIFAIRTSGKQHKANEARRMSSSGSQGPSVESASNGRHSVSSPTSNNTEELSRPLSPDSPQILSELQHYAEAATTHQTHHGSSVDSIQANNSSNSASHRLAIQCMNQPISSSSLSGASDSLLALDLRGKKRKSLSPSTEERARRQQSKHQSFDHGYSVPSGYAMPSVSLNHNINNPFAPLANQMYGSSSSSYYQLPHMLGDSHLAFPGTTDPLLTAGNPSSSAATSASASLPPFMLNPTLAGMLPSYSLPFSQPLLPDARMFSPFQNPVLPSNLPRNMAPSYPGYMLPHAGYPASGTSLQPQGSGNTELGEVSELGSSEDEGKDDDVIDITGK